jgi:hypothetical protein
LAIKINGGGLIAIILVVYVEGVDIKDALDKIKIFKDSLDN